MMKTVTLALTGASGMPYGIRLLESAKGRGQTAADAARPALKFHAA